jgi:hypothetical protein
MIWMGFVWTSREFLRSVNMEIILRIIQNYVKLLNTQSILKI